MPDVTRILSEIEHGDPDAAEQLLPLVYDELRKLAAAKMAQEDPGQTLQATALVHEAYLRLVDVEKVQHWNSRGHFFGAAAEAMRRILVDNARRKGSAARRGGDRERVDLEDCFTLNDSPPSLVLALDEALDKLASEDSRRPSCSSFGALRACRIKTLRSLSEYHVQLPTAIGFTQRPSCTAKSTSPRKRPRSDFFLASVMQTGSRFRTVL